MKKQRSLLNYAGGNVATDEISIRGSHVAVLTPEGLESGMTVKEFVGALRQKDPLEDVIWPDGVRFVLRSGLPTMAVVIYEIAPAVHNVKWISPTSSIYYGKGTIYGHYRLSFPFILLIITFAWHPAAAGDQQNGGLRLTQRNEVYFRREPLRSLGGTSPGGTSPDNALLFPALLNASKYKSSSGRFDVPTKNLVWLCNQHMPISCYDQLPTNQRIRRSTVGLASYLLTSGFNYSSSRNPSALASGEEESWYEYQIRQGIDERISTVERWQEETRKNPGFILDVPFIPSGFSAGQIAARILNEFNMRTPEITSSEDLARIVLNHRPGVKEKQISYPNRLWPTNS
jgi:hypothetical protein